MNHFLVGEILYFVTNGLPSEESSSRTVKAMLTAVLTFVTPPPLDLTGNYPSSLLGSFSDHSDMNDRVAIIIHTERLNSKVGLALLKHTCVYSVPCNRSSLYSITIKI